MSSAPPLDFVLGNARLNGATLNVTNGAAIGFYSTTNEYAALMLECGAAINSVIKPNHLNQLVWYNTVQEQSNTNWTGGTNGLDIFAYDNYACSPVAR